jgi:hypothetical protein
MVYADSDIRQRTFDSELGLDSTGIATEISDAIGGQSWRCGARRALLGAQRKCTGRGFTRASLSSSSFFSSRLSQHRD